MTRESLKGNPRIYLYVGCNGDSRKWYASCQQEQSRMYMSFNGDSRVRQSTHRKLKWHTGQRVNASHVIPIYSVQENFNPIVSFYVPTYGKMALRQKSAIWFDNSALELWGL